MLKSQIAIVRRIPTRTVITCAAALAVLSLLLIAAATGHGALMFAVLSFALILTTALGVLWYTAREHRPQR